jgi:TusA-related sulfurtransferase
MRRMLEEHTIDLRGYRCPLSLIKLKQRMKTLDRGDRLTVVTDDLDSFDDFTSHSISSGCAMSEIAAKGAGVFEFNMVKGVSA